MIVIKLGGSLLTSGWLVNCLETIEQRYQGRAIVIVPGGGVFAEQVRRLQHDLKFNDRAAHCMAVLAMQQTALLLQALKPEFRLVKQCREFVKLEQQRRVSVWSPDIRELDAANIPATWAITSDSLAAWLAGKLAAETLLLVKSVNIDANFDTRKLADENIVDASFFEFTKQAQYSINIVHARQFIG